MVFSEVCRWRKSRLAFWLAIVPMGFRVQVVTSWPSETTSSTKKCWQFPKDFSWLFGLKGYPGTMNDEEDISSEIDTFRDLCGLQTRDVNSRSQFLESLGKTLKAWTNRRQGNVEHGVENFLSDILPCILRLSFRSPFLDIRESCSELLLAVKVWNMGDQAVCVPTRKWPLTVHSFCFRKKE